MELNVDDRPVLNKYRDRAVWGGCALGALIGAVIGGPHVASWVEPIKSYSIYILAGAVIGLILGYAFYLLFLRSLTDGTIGLAPRTHDGKSEQHSSLSSFENLGDATDVYDSGHD